MEMTLVEPTAEQQAVIDDLAVTNHLVLVEPYVTADGDDALKLTPANFCTNCGGDGFELNEQEDRYVECHSCRGTGGVPSTHPPLIVLESGTRVSR